MNPIELEYRRLRRGFTLPARWAWDWSRRKERLKARKAELGLAWQTERGASRRAVWHQDGFELIASIGADPDGGSLPRHRHLGPLQRSLGSRRHLPSSG